MFDVASLLAHQPVPQGRRVAILTNAGRTRDPRRGRLRGAGADARAALGGDADALRAFLPAAASVGNPIDMLATAGPEQYRKSLRLLLADGRVDAVLVIFIPPIATGRGRGRCSDPRMAPPARPRPCSRPSCPPRERRHDSRPFPRIRFPRVAALALARAAFVRPVARGAGGGGSRRRPESISPPRAPSCRRRSPAAEAGSTPWRPQSLLDAFRLPLAQTRIARGEEEAVALAGSLGYPVVLKALGPAILHKTEVGGVQTGARAIRRGAARFPARCAAASAKHDRRHPPADGPGRRRRSSWASARIRRSGRSIAYGSGGTLVELLAGRRVPAPTPHVEGRRRDARRSPRNGASARLSRIARARRGGLSSIFCCVSARSWKHSPRFTRWT